MVTSFGLPMSLPFKSNSGSKYSSRVIAVGLLLAAYSVVLVVLYKEREGGWGWGKYGTNTQRLLQETFKLPLVK